MFCSPGNAAENRTLLRADLPNGSREAVRLTIQVVGLRSVNVGCELEDLARARQPGDRGR